MRVVLVGPTQVSLTLKKVSALLWSYFSPLNIIEVRSKSDPCPNQFDFVTSNMVITAAVKGIYVTLGLF